MLLQATFGTSNSAITKHLGLKKLWVQPSRTEGPTAVKSAFMGLGLTSENVPRRSLEGSQKKLQPSNYTCAVAYTPQQGGDMHLFSFRG